MVLKSKHRRGGVLKWLLVLLLLAAAAAVAIYLIYTRGSDMQRGLKDKGEELREKVSGAIDNSNRPAQPEPPAGNPAADPVTARPKVKPPAADPKAVYTVKRPPPVEKTWHTIAAGETPYRIAETYYEDGKLWTIIAEANGLKDPKDFREGMLIVIPGR